MAQLVVMVCLLSNPTECSGEAGPRRHRGRRRQLHQTAGDKADAWQKENSQYFVIGWRCVKK